MTRILLNPATDLPDAPATGPVTLVATLLNPEPVNVIGFTVTDVSSEVTLTAPDDGEAWRLTVRRAGRIVDERTVDFADFATVSWGDLIDVDPTTLGPVDQSRSYLPTPVVLTQADYDALPVVDPTALYLITE